MKKLFLLGSLLYICFSVKAQDSTFIIANKIIPIIKPETKKIRAYIKPGDTIELLNIIAKPYYYVKAGQHEGFIFSSSLQDCPNIRAAIVYKNKSNQYL